MNKFAILLSALALSSFAAAQTVLDISASRDTSIYSSHPNNSNGGGPKMFTGTNGVSGTMRSLLAFDVASVIPSGSTILSVQLKLQLAPVGPSEINNVAATLTAFRLLEDWGEGTTLPSQGGATGGTGQAGDATWNQNFRFSSNWITAGGTMGPPSASASSPSATAGTVTLSSANLALDVQNMLDQPSANFGWILRSSTEGSVGASAQNYWTSETANGPVLTVTYAPVPEPASLAALGLGALVMWKRRRGRCLGD